MDTLEIIALRLFALLLSPLVLLLNVAMAITSWLRWTIDTVVYGAMDNEFFETK